MQIQYNITRIEGEFRALSIRAEFGAWTSGAKLTLRMVQIS